MLDEYKKKLKETETSNDPSEAALKEMLEKMVDRLTVLLQKEETKDSINSDVEWKNPPVVPLQWNGTTGGFLNFFMKIRQNSQGYKLYKMTKAPKPLRFQGFLYGGR